MNKLLTGITTAAATACLIAVAGCGGSAPAAKSTASSTSATARTSASASPSPTTTASAPPAPRVGACYQLGYAEATSPTSSTKPVDCAKRHDTVTIFVGALDPVVDGHLLAVDSTRVQDQLARACPGKVGAWVGGSREAQRLSQFTSVWFSPTLEQSDAGASWFRCDLVVPRSGEALVPLTGTRGVLDSPRGLDTWGSCGNAAPSDRSFVRTRCAEPHSWRAISTYDFAGGTRYLADAAQKAADNACKGKAQDRATDPLEYRWSFEWPTKQKWDAGQRYGLCWVPDKS